MNGQCDSSGQRQIDLHVSALVKILVFSLEITSLYFLHTEHISEARNDKRSFVVVERCREQKTRRGNFLPLTFNLNSNTKTLQPSCPSAQPIYICKFVDNQRSYYQDSLLPSNFFRTTFHELCSYTHEFSAINSENRHVSSSNTLIIFVCLFTRV